jgi:hypothetical protein
MKSDFFFVSSDGQLQIHFVGNDVVACASVYRSNRNYGRIEWRNLAADDRLQRHDNLRRYYHGIFRCLGCGSMSAHAADFEIDRGGARHRVTGCVANFTGFQVRLVVKRNCKIRFRKPGVEIIAQHGGGAVAGLLGGLAQQDQRATPTAL